MAKDGAISAAVLEMYSIRSIAGRGGLSLNSLTDNTPENKSAAFKEFFKNSQHSKEFLHQGVMHKDYSQYIDRLFFERALETDPRFAQTDQARIEARLQVYNKLPINRNLNYSPSAKAEIVLNNLNKCEVSDELKESIRKNVYSDMYRFAINESKQRLMMNQQFVEAVNRAMSEYSLHNHFRPKL
ncbi:MAG: hypothetical protein AB7V32_10410 [Candidatus Berkiella sp.]